MLWCAMPSPPPRPPPVFDPDLELPAGELHLRPIREADAEEVFPFFSDPAFPRFMTWEAHRTLDETREFLRHIETRRNVQQAMTWAVTRKGAIVGCVGLLDLSFKLRALQVNRCELGYWTAPHAQGQGVAFHASQVAMQWAFETLGLHRITVGCVADNEASRKVIERLGFRFVARLEEDCYREDRWWDVLRYALRAIEWRELQGA
jgi:[ribosomal protein S5]-alanine N-acetyltransferase